MKTRNTRNMKRKLYSIKNRKEKRRTLRKQTNKRRIRRTRNLKGGWWKFWKSCDKENELIREYEDIYNDYLQNYLTVHMEKSKKKLMYFLFGLFEKKDISTLEYCIKKYSFSKKDKRQFLLLQCITYLRIILTGKKNIAFNHITEKIKSIDEKTFKDYWIIEEQKGTTPKSKEQIIKEQIIKEQLYMLTVNSLVNSNNPLNKDGNKLQQDDEDLKQFIKNFSEEYEEYSAEKIYKTDWDNIKIRKEEDPDKEDPDEE